MQDLLLTSPHLKDFLDDFAQMMAEFLAVDGEAVWCGVTLLRRNRAGTVASSGARARAVDELQYGFGDGPCLTASREHRLVHVADMRTEPRWGDYTKAAVAEGILSAVGVPFELGEEASAALDVYSDRADRFDEATIASIQRQVLLTSKALRLAVQMDRHRTTQSNLEAAMASRTSIDLAVGMIMNQQQCSQQDAVDTLRSLSNHRNVKLRDLAEQMVTAAGPVTPHFNY
ncbi:GAF and ANTAR domain-containing protein [Kocuria oceani]|uniref:GAF and ANTAR domain-containing protein n=1 Tax=Kocuria oceani TaxID=988827 RepID=UPI004035469A